MKFSIKGPLIHDLETHSIAHAGTDAYILSGNKQAFRHLWMKPSQKWKASVGGIDVQLHKYHVLPPKVF